MDISKLGRSVVLAAAVLLGGAACATGDDSVLPQPDEPAGEGPAASPAAQPGQVANAEPAQANAPALAGKCGCGQGCGKGEGKDCGCGKSCGCGKGEGMGCGCGMGEGMGCGRDPESPGFVDADGDGVCDHFAARHGQP